MTPPHLLNAIQPQHPINVENLKKARENLTLTKMPQVQTSSGHIVEWNRNLIITSLLKETQLSTLYHNIDPMTYPEAFNIALQVENKIKLLNLKFLSGPLIRELTNTVLLENGFLEWRNVTTRVGVPVHDACQIDLGSGFESKENANLQENAETSHKKKADKISKEQYLLLMPPEISHMHLNGDFHIHDLEYFGTRSFCMDWDLRYFFYYGLLGDGTGKRASVAGPAKRAEVAILHAVKALGSAQTNFAGGQGFYNFLTFLAPYFQDMPYSEIEHLMQMFVYEMTQMMVARGGQVVFSSVQLSPGIPKIWKDNPIVKAGKIHNGENGTDLITYGQFEKEVRLGYKALMNVMLEGDYWGKPFNFPKPEISIEPQFMEEDHEFNKAHPDLPTYDELFNLTFELTAKFGTPYFDNQIPEYRGAGEGISCYQCCAYQFSANPESDTEFNDKMLFKDGKHFSMGSWQVLTLNCPRAAYKAEHDDQTLFSNLKHLMDKSIEVFKLKEQWMTPVIESGRMPFATQTPLDPNDTTIKAPPAVDISSLVFTIGVLGINEMVQYHTGSQIHESKEAYRLAVRTMTEMEMYARQLSQEHNIEIALARTPAETTVERFAISDLLHEDYAKQASQVLKGDVQTALRHIHDSTDLPVYYTNGTHVPPGADISLMHRIQTEHGFFPIVDGGNIMHIWLGEGSPDAAGLKDFALNICKNTQTGYFAFTKDMTMCLNDSHMMNGLRDKCENCGSTDVELYSRVTGYIQAVSGWNEAKKQELKDRQRAKRDDLI